MSESDVIAAFMDDMADFAARRIAADWLDQHADELLARGDTRRAVDERLTAEVLRGREPVPGGWLEDNVTSVRGVSAGGILYSVTLRWERLPYFLSTFGRGRATRRLLDRFVEIRHLGAAGEGGRGHPPG